MTCPYDHDELEAERAALADQNQAALSEIQARGQQVNGLTEHYIMTLLEYLAGEELVHIRLEHEIWVGEMLEEIRQAADRLLLTRKGPPPPPRLR